MERSTLDTILFRDGTGQAQRFSAPLNPGYTPIDERSIADLIRFAQLYAKELNFFDSENNVSGTWQNFLGNGSDEGNKVFITELIEYINNPGRFVNDPEKSERFSKPHLALFVSFLQLLEYIKRQLNGFTGKHLDFYYYDILGLNQKKPVPDTADVIVHLTEDVKEYLIPKGTELLAGKDSLGKDLIYKTQQDTVVNQATVQQIKTLYTGKKTLTITQVRDSIKEPDKAFMELLQLALGEPNNQNQLPLYLNAPVDIVLLDGFYKALLPEKPPADVFGYVNGTLMLSQDEFKKLIENYKSTVTDAGTTWKKIEYTLKAAYRRKLLKQAREKEESPVAGFLKMFESALGNPLPGDPLPIYKNRISITDLKILIEDLESNLDDKREAVNYLSDALFLSEEDFKTCMDIYSDTNADARSWLKVYSIIESAEVRKRKDLAPEPLRETGGTIIDTNDARTKALAASNTPRFNTFGKPDAAQESADRFADVGFAISSPQLLLKEGIRTITLTLSFQENK